MKSRVFGVLAATLALATSLTGCSQPVETVTPTEVAFKACLVSSAAGFNDGGVNQSAYYGLLQAEAQYGVATSQVELDPSASTYQIFRAAQKLVSRGCQLVFTMGGIRHQLATLANGNPNIQFVELGAASGAMAQPLQNHNLVDLNFDSRVAFLQAGYLAAAKSASGRVAVMARSDDFGAQRDIWYFRQGVYQYTEQTGRPVLILGAQQAEPATWKLFSGSPSMSDLRARTEQLIAAGADVIFPAGLNGLVVAQVAQSKGKLVIGPGSDWANTPRYASVKGAVLASVDEPYAQVVVAAVARALGVASPTPEPSPVAGEPQTLVATLTAEGQVSFDGVGPQLVKLETDYLSGASTVVEPVTVK